MAKRESNFKNMIVTLFAVTFIASAALGLVNELTKDAIEQANIKAQNSAIAAVLPKFDKLGKSYSYTPDGETGNIDFFPALDAKGEKVGIAIKTYTNNGFSGLITVMVGFTNDGNIYGYQVLNHQETPGLGSKMNDWFRNETKEKQNIIGKSPGKANFTVTKDGGDIDGITASTISSRAFLESIQRAYNSWKKQTDANSGASNKNNKKGNKL
jgi:electron transport complex protein RnfG